MIKKIKIELVVIGILILNIIITANINIQINQKFDLIELISTNNYLKNFFLNITEIGNSLWFFIISIFVYLICFVSIKKNNQKLFLHKLKDSSLFIFISLLVTGFITQIIKHLIGRPRPNYFEEGGLFGVNFFNLDSAFHSFPSGHTSTIFIVGIVFAFFTPRIKYVYLFFAFVVGFSRVVVGAHYFSDVLGGIAIAFIGFKVTVWIFSKLKKDQKIINQMKFDPSLFFLSIIIFFITIIFLTVGSSLDLLTGSLFYMGNQVFYLQSFDYITVLAREIFLPFLVLYILVLPIISLYLPINKIYFNLKFNFNKIIFLWFSLFFNIVFVVNFLLKGLWGRARPNDISDLGGKENFTPWFEVSNECMNNCSFVSGDASVGFSLIILFFLFNKKIFYWMALFSGFFLGIIRILEGGHFLSDIVIAGFLIFILTYIQSKIYIKRFQDGF